MSKPTNDLAFLRHLPEGGTIRERAARVDEIDARIADLAAQIAALKVDRKAIIRRGRAEAAAQWTAAEIRDAEIAAQESGK